MDNITNPHDKLFRETLSDREVAADFLQHYLPEDILTLTDLNSLEISKDSFVEDDLKDYHSEPGNEFPGYYVSSRRDSDLSRRDSPIIARQFIAVL
jgi:predicted transposase YdaD